MIDLALDGQNHDLVIENGDLQLVSNGDEIVQSCKIRLLFIAGEWFLDYTLGVPWFDQMFLPYVPQIMKEQSIKQAITKTIGVTKLLRFDFGIDAINRGAQIDFTAETIYGPIDTFILI